MNVLPPVPAWLQQFYKEWKSARGARLEPAQRAYARDWQKLLMDSGILRSEDQQTAAREADAWEKFGIGVKRHRYRKFIERIFLPLEKETWFRQMFTDITSGDLLNSSLESVRTHMAVRHERIPVEWFSFCKRLETAFLKGLNVGIFRWRQPRSVKELLEILCGLTTATWPDGTLIRHASKELNLDSKRLEKHRRSIERGLSEIFLAPVSFEDLGLSSLSSWALVAGPCVLHFEDGSIQHFSALQGSYTIDAKDLQRATRIETTALRLLSVENAKTTFRQIALANQDQSTLLIATSFPTAAVKLFLEKLTPELPHYHFGDTDAAGYAILRFLRRATTRHVHPFLMAWRPSEHLIPLTNYDFCWLEKLEHDSTMEDCWSDFDSMRQAGSKGNYEQEAYGVPNLQYWPFYSSLLTFEYKV